MTNFFTRLVARTAGQLPQVLPRITPRYDHAPDLPGPVAPPDLEQHEEVAPDSAPQLAGHPALAIVEPQVDGSRENLVERLLDRAVTPRTPAAPARSAVRELAEPNNAGSAAPQDAGENSRETAVPSASGKQRRNDQSLTENSFVVPRAQQQPRSLATSSHAAARPGTADTIVPPASAASADSSPPDSVVKTPLRRVGETPQAELSAPVPATPVSPARSELGEKTGVPAVRPGIPTPPVATPKQTAAAARQSASAAAPIRINIGRIEVRANTPPPSPAPAAPTLRSGGPARLSMADYLKQTRGSRP